MITTTIITIAMIIIIAIHIRNIINNSNNLNSSFDWRLAILFATITNKINKSIKGKVLRGPAIIEII